MPRELVFTGRVNIYQIPAIENVTNQTLSEEEYLPSSIHHDPVVWWVDNAVQRISCYPTDKW